MWVERSCAALICHLVCPLVSNLIRRIGGNLPVLHKRNSRCGILKRVMTPSSWNKGLFEEKFVLVHAHGLFDVLCKRAFIDTEFCVHSKTKLPPVEVDDQFKEEIEESPVRPSTRMTQVSIPLPQSSITGMKGEEAEKFEELQDSTSKVEPKCHLWTPTGDLLIGCADGQILKVSMLFCCVLCCKTIDVGEPLPHCRSRQNNLNWDPKSLWEWLAQTIKRQNDAHTPWTKESEHN